MKYRIMVKDTCYSKTECYGEFDNLREATEHFNRLKISFGTSLWRYRFKIEREE